MTSVVDAAAAAVSLGLPLLPLSLQPPLSAPRHHGFQQQQQHSPRSISPPNSLSPSRHNFSSAKTGVGLPPPSSSRASSLQIGASPYGGLPQPSNRSGLPLPSVSPPPASSNPENNTCRLVDYRGARVASFNVDGRQLICLPQAFDLFLKHLVGGLHTVYTKLKRLDVTPVVCNVEQVRVLRGLGAIQPGVNRCKLISPAEFDILYEDCTNSSARPGRPPKRSIINGPPDGLQDVIKKGCGMLEQIIASSPDYFSSPSGKHHLLDGLGGAAVNSLHHHHQHHHSSVVAPLGVSAGNSGVGSGTPLSSGHHRGGPGVLPPVLHGTTPGSPPNGFGPVTAAGLMSFAAELQKSSTAAGAGFLGPLPPVLSSAALPGGPISGSGPPSSSMQTVPGSPFPYPPAHLAAVAAAAAAGHFAFLPLAAAAAGHPAAGMMNLATMAAAAGHLQSMRAANAADQHVGNSLVADAAQSRLNRGDNGGRMMSSTPQLSRSHEYNNNAEHRVANSGNGKLGHVTRNNEGGQKSASPTRGVVCSDTDRPLNLEMHGKRVTSSSANMSAIDRSVSSSRTGNTDRDSVSSGGRSSACSAQEQLDLSQKPIVGESGLLADQQYGRRSGISASGCEVLDDDVYERNSETDVGVDDSEDEMDRNRLDCLRNQSDAMCNGVQPMALNDRSDGSDVIGCGSSKQNKPFITGDDLMSLEALFVNIQGLVTMAVEQARKHQQQVIFERADLNLKITKERQICDSLSKQLVEEKKLAAALQRRLRRERKVRRRLETHMKQSSHYRRQRSEQQLQQRQSQQRSPGGSSDNDVDDMDLSAGNQKQIRQQMTPRTDRGIQQYQQQRPQTLARGCTSWSPDYNSRPESGRRRSGSIAASDCSSRSSGDNDAASDTVGAPSRGGSEALGQHHHHQQSDVGGRTSSSGAIGGIGIETGGCGQTHHHHTSQQSLIGGQNSVDMAVSTVAM